MALQGTIESFPLVDVLQLLATSAKTGRLDLVGDRGRGAVWVENGVLVAGSIRGRETSDASDLIWELLRFGDGSFEFLVGEAPDEAGFSAAVADTVEQAVAMLGEWTSVVERIPGPDHRVGLTVSIPREEVTLDAGEWSIIVAAGPSPTVTEVLEDLGLSEFGGCRRLADLVDRGLIAVEAESTTVPADPFGQAEVPDFAPGDEEAGDGTPLEDRPISDLYSESLGADEGLDPAQHGFVDAEPVSQPTAPAQAEPVQLEQQQPEPVQPEPVQPAPVSAETQPLHQTPPQPADEVAAQSEPVPAEALTYEPAPAVESPGAGQQPWVQDAGSSAPAEAFPEHFPIDDLVSNGQEPGWGHEADTGAQAATASQHGGGHADRPEPDAVPSGMQSPASGSDGQDDVLAQIGRLSPKAAEAIAAALGDEPDSPQ